IMPSIITVSSSEDLNNVLDELLKDDMELMKISKSIRKDFDKFLSAKSRVELLIKLYKEDHTKYSISKRATLWRNDNSILGKIKSFISF
ncbi:hypothetical protein U5N28_12065, partial [Lysinibacillus telephonicus]|uniref:hypothetical protein n=1 Tax=Lysinibacillus telephonicus TaxID=1714840 RepID=UPI00397BAE3A